MTPFNKLNILNGKVKKSNSFNFNCNCDAFVGKADIILLGEFNGIAYLLQFMGQVWTTAGIATILINMYVLYMPIFSRFILKKNQLEKKIAVIIGFIGIIIIAPGDFLSFGTNDVTLN